MPEEESPVIDMHESFKRDPQKKSAVPIVYPNLDDAAATAKSQEQSALKKTWDSRRGSVEEEANARKAAIGYLVLTGKQLQSAKPSERQRVSDRFTEASIELYGKPDPREVMYLAVQQLREFRDYAGIPSVDQERLQRATGLLTDQIGDNVLETEAQDSSLESALGELKTAIHEKYGDVLNSFEFPGMDSATKLPPEEVARLFQSAIDELAKNDSSWTGWKAIVTEDSAPSCNSRKKLIGVGCEPREIARLKPTFAHEALGHALRSVNGSKTGNEHLQYGMPGGTAAEEGVAVILAAAVRGSLISHSKNLYLDTAIALGQLDRPPLTREELHQLHLDRQIIREQAKGNKFDEAKLSDKSWTTVNRIYRGLRGDENIGANTHDTSYYRGLITISNWLKSSLAGGKKPAEIFEIMTSAKIDPTNPRDLEYFESHLAA